MSNHIGFVMRQIKEGECLRRTVAGMQTTIEAMEEFHQTTNSVGGKAFASGIIANTREIQKHLIEHAKNSETALRQLEQIMIENGILK